jgi:hypothetical protein
MDTQFDLPSQDLKQLSFCQANKEAIEEWVKQLPMADMGKTTKMLYHALEELSQLQASPQLRFELVKAIRPALNLTREGLRKSFLNQPVIMPDQPRKIANLCQALQRRLAIVYLVIARDAAKKMGGFFKKPSALLCQAIYAAMDAYLDILIRNFALYRPIETGLWQNIHKLHAFAKQYHLNDTAPTLYNARNKTTIDTLYKCCLLWGGIKANQLRQKDILCLKPYVKEWASLLHLGPVSDDENAGLIVDPDSDMGPMYQKFMPEQPDSHCLGLYTDDLILELKQIGDPLVPSNSNENLTENLINHLILAWGVFTDRTFMRLESNSSLSLCIGLSTTHYYLSEQKTFVELVYGEQSDTEHHSQAAHFQARRAKAQKAAVNGKSKDVWNLNQPVENKLNGSKKTEKELSAAQVTLESIDYHIRSGGHSSMTMDGSDKEKYHNYNVDVVNMSPQGYCLEWSDSAPHSIKAGEIIGIKETHHLGWNIGAIRWVKQGNPKSPNLQIGVELLSPTAEAFGAHIVDASGNPQSDFMRVLKLPEIKAAGQPATLVTPALSFRSGQKIILAKNGKEQTAKLTKLIASSGSYFLFTFEMQETLAKAPSSVTIEPSLDSHQDGEFDSVWETL